MNKHDKDLQTANSEFCDIVGACFVFLTANGIKENEVKNLLHITLENTIEELIQIRKKEGGYWVK